MTPFFMAWGMFCALPCPVKKWDGEKYPAMLLCLPLVGLLIGGLWALGAWLLSRWQTPALVMAAVLTALPILLTGGIHLDGYMDCADAILSRRDRETRLKILKDPHVGSFAAMALGLLLLGNFALFASADMAGRCLFLLFIPAVCRACSALAVLTLKPLDTSGYAAMYGSRVKPRHRWLAAVLLAVLTLCPLLLGLSGLCAMAGALGSWAVIVLCRKDLGGMSGDISGCAITVGELCAVAALVLL